METLVKPHGACRRDFVVVRENTEGLYASTGGFLKKGTPDESRGPGKREHAPRGGADACGSRSSYAGREDRTRNGSPSVRKTNVLTFAGDLYWRVVDEVADREYPDVEP